MQLAAADAGIFHGIDEHRMREEFSVQDHKVEARDVHVHNAPGTNIEMADFAVAHLPFRQPDKRPAGVNQRVRILAQQPVVDRLGRGGGSVGLGFGAVSPAVEDDENERFRTGHKSALSSWLLAIGFRLSASETILVELLGGTWPVPPHIIYAAINVRKDPLPISSVQYSGSLPHRENCAERSKP